MEIYNENVRDLLGKDQNAKLEVYSLSCSKTTGILPTAFSTVPPSSHFHGIFPFSRKVHIVFSLLMLHVGKGEARCWSLCKGFVILCYEQCG